MALVTGATFATVTPTIDSTAPEEAIIFVTGVVYTTTDITSNPGIFTDTIGVSGGALGSIGEAQ